MADYNYFTKLKMTLSSGCSNYSICEMNEWIIKSSTDKDGQHVWADMLTLDVCRMFSVFLFWFICSLFYSGS